MKRADFLHEKNRFLTQKEKVSYTKRKDFLHEKIRLLT